jgi:hypothetical protein
MKTEQHTAKGQWVNKEIREEIKNFLKANEDENTTYQNLWDTVKTLRRGKVIAISAILKNQFSNKQTHNAP